VPLRLVDDHWVAEEYAASDLDLPTLYKFYLMGIYVMQKQGLKQLHDKAGISMNLETLRVHKDSSGKIDHFTVTWPDDGPVLLPAANKIQFKRKKGVSSLPALISGNWDTVSKIVGHRMKKLDLYPTLYVATSFPTKQELEKITEKST